MICNLIESIRFLMIPTAVLFVCLFDRFFIQNKHIYHTTLIICSFLTFAWALPTLHYNLSEEYHCREIDALTPPEVNFTNRTYTHEEYKKLFDSCTYNNGHPKYIVQSLNQTNHTVTIYSNQIDENLPVIAAECFQPQNKTGIVVWGDCEAAAKKRSYLPKHHYICNPGYWQP
jgi:hypothetical protein